MRVLAFRGCPVFLKPSWVVQVLIGPGAGYIGGCTLYLGHNSSSLQWLRQYRGGKPTTRYRWWEYFRIGTWEAGITRNWNVIPTVRW